MKLRGTEAAGLKSRLPAWDAVMVHPPAPTMRTLVPVTVQVPAAANDTASDDVVVAVTAKSGSPNVLFTNAAKLIVWFP